MADQILVPIAEGQRLLGGISRSKIYDLLGDLQTIKLGSRRMIIKASIADYIAKLASTDE